MNLNYSPSKFILTPRLRIKNYTSEITPRKKIIHTNSEPILTTKSIEIFKMHKLHIFSSNYLGNKPITFIKDAALQYQFY